MVSNIQKQFASAFANNNLAGAAVPPVQVVVPPQPIQGGGSPWKWIAIFLVGVILVGVVIVFTQKSAPKGKRVRDVLEEAEEFKPKKQKKKHVTFDVPVDLKEEEEEEDPPSTLPPELLNDPKFTSMQEIVKQKQLGTLK
tara:strand:- start:1105 stop:1524 length:420 start_codon:yes stop_codon:yes gene_type:complete